MSPTKMSPYKNVPDENVPDEQKALAKLNPTCSLRDFILRKKIPHKNSFHAHVSYETPLSDSKWDLVHQMIKNQTRIILMHQHIHAYLMIHIGELACSVCSRQKWKRKKKAYFYALSNASISSTDKILKRFHRKRMIQNQLRMRMLIFLLFKVIEQKTKQMSDVRSEYPKSQQTSNCTNWVWQTKERSD